MKLLIPPPINYFKEFQSCIINLWHLSLNVQVILSSTSMRMGLLNVRTCQGLDQASCLDAGAFSEPSPCVAFTYCFCERGL